MREFILLALKAWTTPDFDIAKLPDAGRMDLVCRCVSNSLCVSQDLRRDTVIHVVMTGPSDPPKVVSFHGDVLIGFSPDEKAIAEIIRKALDVGNGMKLGEEKEVTPGVKVSKKAFETLVKEKAKTSQLIYLHPEGEDLRSFQFPGDITFIFGDYIGLPRNTEKLLDRLGAKRMQLGPKMLFASHCPILVHNELDRRGGR